MMNRKSDAHGKDAENEYKNIAYCDFREPKTNHSLYQHLIFT